MDNITNGLIINGKAIELSKEQITAIAEAFVNPKQDKNISLEKDKTNHMGIEFNSFPDNDFYFINADGVGHSKNPLWGDTMFAKGNYCHQKDVMTYRMYRETLARLIWRFAMEHNKITLTPKDNPMDYRLCTDVQFMQPDYWCDEVPKEKISIEYFMDDETFGLAYRGVEDMSFDVNTTYFDDTKIAERCVEEIVIPYVAEHIDWFPEYKDCKNVKWYIENKLQQ